MERMTAFCGLICTECEGFLATQANDEAWKERLAARGREEYGDPTMTAAAVTCEGCLAFEGRLGGLMAPGADLGGELVNTWVRTLADLETVFLEFQRRQIQVKDVERGLVDFPAIIGGKEVFLCWEQDEEDVEFWHDLDAGYGGRERL